MPTAEAATKPIGSHLIGEMTLKRVGIVVALMLAAYLVGFVPVWIHSDRLEDEAARLRSIDRAHTLKSELAAASLHAGQGRFDEAIAAAGSFFDRLAGEIGATDGTLNNEPAIGEAAVNMLARRDEIVTMLARGDADAEGVLAGWYFEMDRPTNPEGVK